MSTPDPDAGLVVDVEVVARRAGYTLPLTDDARQALRDAIEDAQADVQGYLGRGLLPVEYSESSWRYGPLGAVTSYRLAHGPVVALLEETPVDGGDYYVVRYLAGLDARTAPPIVRYVLAHAAALARQHPNAKGYGAVRRIRSLSVDGQSVSYDAEGGAAGSGSIGSLPNLSALDAYRLRAGVKVFQRRGAPVQR